MSHSTKLHTLLVSSISLLALTPDSALADNLFLLQLGSFNSEKNAAEQSKQVVDSYAEKLAGKKSVIRKNIPLSGGNVSWRVLVGPYENRKDASRSCAELKDAGADCFVVETAAMDLDDFNSAKHIADMESGEQQAAQVTQAKSSNLLPWNWFSGDDKTEASSTKQPEPASETVQTAERSSGSNININTHSVYDEQPKNSSDVTDIATAIGSLFESKTGTQTTETSENVLASAPAEASENMAETVEPQAVAETKEPEEPSVAEVPKAENIEVNPGITTLPVKLPPEPQTMANLELSLGETDPQYTPMPDEPLGEVEVGEAILVPLTEPEDVVVTASEAPKKATTLDIKLPEAPAHEAPKPLAKVKDEVTRKALPKVEAKAETNPVPVAVSQTPIQMNPEKIAQPAPAEVTPQTTAQLVTPEPIEKLESAANAKRLSEQSKPTTKSVVETISSNYDTARLLQVSIFQNDRDAMQCLASVQSGVPSASNIHTRMIKSSTGQAVIRFGPINDRYLEQDICNIATKCSANIRCRVLMEEQPSASSGRMIAQLDPNAPMPKNLSPRRLLTTASIDDEKAVAHTLLDMPVWVQLGTSSSESDAMDKYNNLVTRYPDIMQGLKPTISSPENKALAGEIYRLRIGPFEKRSDARQICATLSARGVGCLVLTK